MEMAGAMLISGTIGWFVLKAELPVASIVFWRCVFGGLTLLLAWRVLGRNGARPTGRVIAIAALGGVAFVLNWVCLFAAFPRASIGIATVIYNTQPFMLVGMAALLLRERPTRSAVAWMAAAFIGLVLIVLARPGAGPHGEAYLAGVLLALAAACFYALAAFVAKKLVGTSPYVIVLIQLCVGAVMLAPFVAGEASPSGVGQWAIVGSMGVVHTGVMCVLLYGAIQKLPTPIVGALSFIYPVVAILVDVLAFGLSLSALQIVGAAMILLAAAGATLGWSFVRRAPVVSPEPP